MKVYEDIYKVNGKTKIRKYVLVEDLLKNVDRLKEVLFCICDEKGVCTKADIKWRFEDFGNFTDSKQRAVNKVCNEVLEDNSQGEVLKKKALKLGQETPDTSKGCGKEIKLHSKVKANCGDYIMSWDRDVFCDDCSLDTSKGCGNVISEEEQFETELGDLYTVKIVCGKEYDGEIMLCNDCKGGGE